MSGLLHVHTEVPLGSRSLSFDNSRTRPPP